ncbi:creatinine amidohydrolase [Halanaerobium saccharolyticum]|uniref:Creatinine amidohydrolase n=1 Tax=Halanaerobium saccharolyticum TaxID=43595 RepID=A0A4R7Z9B5_9FIRM|nr:creatininase family protein [Halanaerobium saccharolyticum]RAK12493.1 creatinine amidohydrolase [Halanaerobium saccharolyticum]TDW06419.1 creatinine amidohydrolase [Halanaerobium saccharolyticum]TDX61667.1 creatinine amidohydrolase [Halanaerobium saccharolyticum]
MNRLSAMSWKDAEKELKNKKVILPLGAVEAHGYHLPLGTDNYIAQEIAKIAAQRLDALLLPIIPYGQVWSLRNFPGSISLSNQTIISMIDDLSESLDHHGVEMLIIINAHFGNMSALKTAERLVNDKYDLKVLRFTHPGLKSLEKKYIKSKRVHPDYLHAEEIETSMMLQINSNLVDMSRAEADTPEIPEYFGSYSVPWDKITAKAVLGDPTLATKEKGEKLITGIAAKIVKIVNNFEKEAE